MPLSKQQYKEGQKHFQVQKMVSAQWSHLPRLQYSTMQVLRAREVIKYSSVSEPRTLKLCDGKERCLSKMEWPFFCKTCDILDRVSERSREVSGRVWLPVYIKVFVYWAHSLMGFGCLEMYLINENSSQERQILILFEAGYQSRKANFTCRASCPAVFYSALWWLNEACLCQVRGCLASKAIRKAARAVPRRGVVVGRAEQWGLLSCQRLQTPAAFTVCWWATGLVASFSLGSADFCSFSMGLVVFCWKLQHSKIRCRFLCSIRPWRSQCWNPLVGLLRHSELISSDYKSIQRSVLTTGLQRPPTSLPGLCRVHFFFWACYIVTWKYFCGVQAPRKLFFFFFLHYTSCTFRACGSVGALRLKVLAELPGAELTLLKPQNLKEQRQYRSWGERGGVERGLWAVSLGKAFYGQHHTQAWQYEALGFCCSPKLNICKWQGGCSRGVLSVPLRLLGVPRLAVLAMHRRASVWKCQPSCRLGTDHTFSEKTPFFPQKKTPPVWLCWIRKTLCPHVKTMSVFFARTAAAPWAGAALYQVRANPWALVSPVSASRFFCSSPSEPC